MIPTTRPRLVTMMVSPLLVRSKTSDVLRVTSRTPIVVVVMPICYNIDPGLKTWPGSLDPEPDEPARGDPRSGKGRTDSDRGGSQPDRRAGLHPDQARLASCSPGPARAAVRRRTGRLPEACRSVASSLRTAFGYGRLPGHSLSPGRSRAPRSVVTARPAANTSAAHSAPARSCCGRAGHSHGVVKAGGCHTVYSAYTPATRYAVGPVQDSPPPRAAAHSSPMPVIPATLRITSSVPPDRCPPVPAATTTAPIAVAVSVVVTASRKYGSQRPVTRSDSPNGLAAVATTPTPAAT